MSAMSTVITDTINNELNNFKDLQDSEIVLPTSELPVNSGINANLLFIEPDINEMPKLAFENNKRKKLNKEQIESIRQNGYFEVPSEEFEGQFHKIVLSHLLSKGKEIIHEEQEEGRVSALEHILVEAPDRITSNEHINVKDGFKNIEKSLLGILDLAIGLSSVKPIHTVSEVDDLMEEKRLMALIEQFNTSNIDVHKYDLPQMHPVTICRRDTFEMNASFHEQCKLLRKKEFSNDDSVQQIKLKENVKENEQFFDISQLYLLGNLMDKNYISQDEMFSDLRNVLGERAELYILQLKYIQCVKEKMSLYEENKEEALKNFIETYKKKHTIRSKIVSILKKEEEEFLKRYNEENPKENVYDEAMQQFMKMKGKRDKKKQIKQLYLLNKNILEEIEEERVRLESESEPTTINHWNMFGKEFSTNSGMIGWRWIDMFLRMGNICYTCGKFGWKNIIYSTFGLRSIWGVENFSIQKVQEEKFSDLEVINGKPIHKIMTPYEEKKYMRATLIGKLIALWENISKDRENFNNAPDKGFLGKGFLNIPNWIWNYAVKGVVGSIGMILYHLIAMAINFIVDVVAMVACPVLGVAGGLAVYLTELLLFDLHHKKNSPFFLPLLRYIIENFIFKGVGQILSAILLSCFHLIIGSSELIINEVTTHLRILYDNLVLRFVIEKRGRIPCEDVDGIFGLNLTKRVSGPGIGKNYYYQLPLSLGLFMFKYMLEKEEMEWYKIHMTNIICEPSNQIDDFLNNFNKVGLMNNHSTSQQKALYESKEKRLNELNEKITAHWNNLNISGSTGKVKISMTSENLNLLLDTCYKMCDEFLSSHVFKFVDEEKFWTSKQIIDNTREEKVKNLIRHYLSRQFGHSILIPIEEMDEKGFCLKIHDTSFEEITDSLMGKNIYIHQNKIEGLPSDTVMSSLPVYVKEEKKNETYKPIVYLSPNDLNEKKYHSHLCRIEEKYVEEYIFKVKDE